MKNTACLLTLTTLTAVTASAATGDLSKTNSLKYDRVTVSYGQSDNYNGTTIRGVADIGQYLLIGMARSDLSGRGNLKGFDFNTVSGSLGAKFNAGPGDIYAYYTYGQLQGGGSSGSIVAVADGEVSAYTVGYRVAVSPSFEINADVTRSKSTTGVLALNTSNSQYLINSQNDRSTDWSIFGRYNFSKTFDIYAGYTFSGTAGADTWQAGLGLSF